MPSLLPKLKLLSIQKKNCSKIEINFSRNALFHTNTKVCLTYFGHDFSILYTRPIILEIYECTLGWV